MILFTCIQVSLLEFFFDSVTASCDAFPFMLQSAYYLFAFTSVKRNVGRGRGDCVSYESMTCTPLGIVSVLNSPAVSSNCFKEFCGYLQCLYSPAVRENSDRVLTGL